MRTQTTKKGGERKSARSAADGILWDTLRGKCKKHKVVNEHYNGRRQGNNIQTRDASRDAVLQQKN